MLDIVIIGSGPAGLSAAVYAKRANLSAVVVEKEYLGTGQIAESGRVDNYLGFVGIDGYTLGENFRNHAEEMGVSFMEGNVTGLTVKNSKNDNGRSEENKAEEIKISGEGVVDSELSSPYWEVMLEEGEPLKARTVIFAAGCTNKALGIPGEKEFRGKGLSFCAVCDGAFYKDKSVAVIGGGDTALDDALYLSDMCKTVYLVHRRDKFRGSASTLEKLKNRDNVVIKTKVKPAEIGGDRVIETLKLDNGEELQVSGVFVAIGMSPNTSILEDLDKDTADKKLLDNAGYVIADEDCRTALKGLYVAGDARTKRLRQVITAASDGANAVCSILDCFQN